MPAAFWSAQRRWPAVRQSGRPEGRTIADLAGEEKIRQPHLAEAVQCRGWVGSWGAGGGVDRET
ncbi:hypothetical protein C2E25_14140 [Geothermobacter hydrogeniphilus]|uniref:Mg chelatase-related protein C-terminal domain-containing protein n=1 Tax=Geothermobacter hydrogeniphilus TaxID=1969733 RepID=A0A2K2H7C9_9BACT|nr:hypothetical protein [Geothermobacter hydrogeniphilus]PNU19133.1 hypothetical protein C2E25_14140 [Geothermobacter hydrogeniphilus]